MITVFYDGKCGLCSKENNHHRAIAPDGIFNGHDLTVTADGQLISQDRTSFRKRLYEIFTHCFNAPIHQ